MERERAFDFKLFVPPWTSSGQVPEVKPQDSREDSCAFVQTTQGCNKSFDKESRMAFQNTNMVMPTKTTRGDVTKKMSVMPMGKEEKTLKPDQLYSKLLNEAEKIKSWKLKMDSELLQKDRKLQENKKTIETQRKAIQDLQFGNESLSMKLEDQLNENEDLRNKSNATRDLCNILKDTFERSAEKMSLFESEREETHHIFIQNNANIQRMVAAFGDLQLRAEADQQEMLKVKHGLQQFENLKVKLENDLNLKQEEVAILQAKLRDKESELEEILRRLMDTQESFSHLQESAKKDQELLQNMKHEQEGLAEKLQRVEQLRQDAQENQSATANTLELCKVEHVKTLLEKNTRLEQLDRTRDQLEGQLLEIQTTEQALQSSLTAEIQRAQDLEERFLSISDELNKKNTELGEIRDHHARQIQVLKDDMDIKSDSIRALEEKIRAHETDVIQLTSEFEGKRAEIHKLKEKVEAISSEEKKKHEALEKVVEERNALSDAVLLKEAKLQELERDLSEALKNDKRSARHSEMLKEELKQCREKFENLQKSKANEEEEIERLEEENEKLHADLESLTQKIEKDHQETENIQEQLEECSKRSLNEQMKKEKQIKALEQKLTKLKTKVENKQMADDEIIKANKALKAQITSENEKCSRLEAEINELRKKSKMVQIQHDEELKRIQDDLLTKSMSEAQFFKQVQNLKQMATDANKSKEDAEMKCQHKINDMVALMEKHKHEYDRMVEEKDTELNERRKKEAEISANKTAMVLELSQLQIENKDLKQQLQNNNKDREKLKDVVEELKNTRSALQDSHTQKEELEQEILALKKEIKPVKKDKPIKSTQIEALQTPTWDLGTRAGATPHIKSFRIRTPPPTERLAPWGMDALELDPKSDSSEQNDVLSFSSSSKISKTQLQLNVPGSVRQSVDICKKVQSPAVYKSPGSALKLAAMKRMRDAGWTAVTSFDKKKRKSTDKIFA